MTQTTDRPGRTRYVLGYSMSEQERLESQAAFLSGLTEDLLRKSGIGPGMRVLDVGCGMGDVSLIAARLVGPTGSVVGVDRNGDGLGRAAERAAEQGLANVTFRQSELSEFEVDGRYDALVGRLVLMYFPDPSEALRSLSRHLVPGGIVAFHEFMLSYAATLPPIPAFKDNLDRLCEVFRRVGFHPDMGMRLHSAFRDAGIEATLIGGARLDGDAEGFCPAWITHTVRSALPMMEKTGVATAAEVDVDTLEDRIRQGIDETGAVILGPLMIGAWGRVPA